MQQYANMQPMLGQMGGIGPVGTMVPGTPSNMQPILGLQGSREAQQQQQLYEAQQQQLVDAAREQEMFRNFEQQQLQQLQQQQQSQHHQQIDLMRYNRGFDVTGPSGQQVNTSGFTHLTGPSNMAPSLALGGSYDNAMHSDGAIKLRLLKPAKLNQENRLNPTLDRSLLPIKDGE
ncbi:hypothetical protein Tco_0065455 [Tanacetum coccineum]